MLGLKHLIIPYPIIASLPYGELFYNICRRLIVIQYFVQLLSYVISSATGDLM